MTGIREILIPLSGRYDPDDPEELDTPALQIGFEVARRFGAHAEVLCITSGPPEVGDDWPAWLPDYGTAAQLDMIREEAEARRRRARDSYQRVRAACDPVPVELAAPGPGHSVRFVERIGDVRETVGAFGRLSDLIVLASSVVRWEMPFRPILEASLRRTACPVLVSPAAAPTRFATRIAIAWNDTIESARAVAAALPFLATAEQVTIICCKEHGSVAPDPRGLIEYLAWHGIEAAAVEIDESPRKAGAGIVDRALAESCDLLVLGAYLHSRGHSLLFGSVTEAVLHHPRLPALLAS